MLHRYLDHAHMHLARQDEDLGIDQRSVRVQLHPLQQVSPDQFERAVHVTHQPAKEDPYQAEEGPGVEPPSQRIPALAPKDRADLRRAQPAHGAKPTRVKTVTRRSRVNCCHSASCCRSRTSGWPFGSKMASGLALSITAGQPSPT